MMKLPNSQGRIVDTPVNIGIQPIAEKNFVFEMLVSFLVDEKSHKATALKLPEFFEQVFSAEGEGKLITKEDGERIAVWNGGGKALSEIENLCKRAKLAAEDGGTAYEAFFKSITLPQRKMLLDSGDHGINKERAAQVDRSERMTPEEDAAWLAEAKQAGSKFPEAS